MSADKRVIAVVGCATVGSEVAALAAEAGALVLAIDEAPRPYGELESSVPSWHLALVGGSIGRIDENLAHPDIAFVPRTGLGRDVSLEALEALGVTVIEATGRKRESVPALPGSVDAAYCLSADALMSWFNRRGHLAWPGPDVVLPAHVAVVGNGLAAFEAARLVSIELHRRALEERGHVIGPESLVREGLAATLKRLGVTTEQLGVAPVSLVISEGLDAFLLDAPTALRGAAIDALRTRDLVNLLPGFELVDLVDRGAGRMLSLVNTRAEGFVLSHACELLVDGREVRAGHQATGSALSDVFGRFEPSLLDKLWEARLVPARSDEAAIMRGEVLAEAVGSAVRELARATVDEALARPCPAGTTERATAWARGRQDAVGFDDYASWIGATRRRWLY